MNINSIVESAVNRALAKFFTSSESTSTTEAPAPRRGRKPGVRKAGPDRIPRSTGKRRGRKPGVAKAAAGPTVIKVRVERQAIVDAIRAGNHDATGIAKACGYDVGNTRQALGLMVKQGTLVRPERGRFAENGTTRTVNGTGRTSSHDVGGGFDHSDHPSAE